MVHCSLCGTNRVGRKSFITETECVLCEAADETKETIEYLAYNTIQTAWIAPRIKKLPMNVVVE